MPTDGSALSVDLKSDEVYGLYSQDAGLRCTATAPGGAPVEVTDPIARSQSSPPQVPSLTTRGAGTYRVSCEATNEVVLNTAEVSPARQRAQNVFVLSGPTTIVGLVSAVTGTVWLVRRRRRRAALVVSRPQTGLGADGPVSAAPQAAAAWGGLVSRPSRRGRPRARPPWARAAQAATASPRSRSSTARRRPPTAPEGPRRAAEDGADPLRRRQRRRGRRRRQRGPRAPAPPAPCSRAP